MSHAVTRLLTRAALGFAVSACALTAVLPTSVTAAHSGTTTGATAPVVTTVGGQTPHSNGGDIGLKEWNSTGS
ncbi:hypothetical protein [Kitasatospora sp. GP82]|uniref:hypothetical protein n=1 Tax=Kitasatospora sp. GP82 TaxID=3035089 RepID=UPI0024759368|nr:hypothetical protein [Kitasatospora sp. GP82]MDH6125881.1 hypothetical protein [Kitasatospora sp. GP82]